MAVAIILTFVFIIIFILISKNDLGVKSLTNEQATNETLVGKIATGFPGSNISGNSTLIKEDKIAEIDSSEKNLTTSEKDKDSKP